MEEMKSFFPPSSPFFSPRRHYSQGHSSPVVELLVLEDKIDECDARYEVNEHRKQGHGGATILSGHLE